MTSHYKNLLEMSKEILIANAEIEISKCNVLPYIRFIIEAAKDFCQSMSLQLHKGQINFETRSLVMSDNSKICNQTSFVHLSETLDITDFRKMDPGKKSTNGKNEKYSTNLPSCKHTEIGVLIKSENQKLSKSKLPVNLSLFDCDHSFPLYHNDNLFEEQKNDVLLEKNVPSDPVLTLLQKTKESLENLFLSSKKTDLLDLRKQEIKMAGKEHSFQTNLNSFFKPAYDTQANVEYKFQNDCRWDFNINHTLSPVHDFESKPKHSSIKEDYTVKAEITENNGNPQNLSPEMEEEILELISSDYKSNANVKGRHHRWSTDNMLPCIEEISTDVLCNFEKTYKSEKGIYGNGYTIGNGSTGMCKFHSYPTESRNSYPMNKINHYPEVKNKILENSTGANGKSMCDLKPETKSSNQTPFSESSKATKATINDLSYCQAVHKKIELLQKEHKEPSDKWPKRTKFKNSPIPLKLFLADMLQDYSTLD